MHQFNPIRNLCVKLSDSPMLYGSCLKGTEMNGRLFYGYYSKVWTDSTDFSALMNVIEIFVCIRLNMIHIHRTSTWALLYRQLYRYCRRQVWPMCGKHGPHRP